MLHEQYTGFRLNIYARTEQNVMSKIPNDFILKEKASNRKVIENFLKTILKSYTMIIFNNLIYDVIRYFGWFHWNCTHRVEYFF